MYRLHRKILAVVTIALCAGLAACPIHLVSDYDDQIDSGLTQLNTDVTTFVNKMISLSGTPAGTFAQNKDFYATESAKIDTLIVRAEAHRVLKSCPSSDLITASVKKSIPATPPAGNGPPPPSVSDVLAQIKSDDCSVVLMNLVKTGFGQLQQFHEAQQNLGIPQAAHDPILVGGLGSLIHTAMTVEIALKSGKTVGGSNGT
jgi:hypothetical protein